MMPEYSCQLEFTRNCWYRLWHLNVHVVRSSSSKEKLLVQAMTPECSRQIKFIKTETAGLVSKTPEFSHCQIKSIRRETAGTGYDTWMFMLSDQVHQEKLLVQVMTPECLCCQIKFIKRETAGAGYGTCMYCYYSLCVYVCVWIKMQCWIKNVTVFLFLLLNLFLICAI